MKHVLHEIKNVRQEEAAVGQRRWFESDGLELVVWLAPAGTILGFQLCYDLGEGEHALTWREGCGFAHSAIDTGDDSPFANRTPILHPDGQVPWAGITQLFDARGEVLDPELRQLVRDKLTECSGADAGR